MKLFISPHNDDETLFGAFTLLRERPMVLIVTDSARQKAKGITAYERHQESRAALAILGVQMGFLGIPDDLLELPELQYKVLKFIQDFGPFEAIFLPAFESGGNVDHNVVSRICVPGLTPTRYLTYTAAGKSRSEKMVPFEPGWPLLKLQALACYRSQIFEPSTRDHFLRDQYEYYA